MSTTTGRSWRWSSPPCAISRRSCARPAGAWTTTYWDFIARHADRFAGNHRMRMITKAWERKPEEEKAALRAAAAAHLDALEPYG